MHSSASSLVLVSRRAPARDSESNTRRTRGGGPTSAVSTVMRREDRRDVPKPSMHHAILNSQSPGPRRANIPPLPVFMYGGGGGPGGMWMRSLACTTTD